MFSRRIYVWKVCLKNYSSIWSWQKKKKKKNKKPVGLCSFGLYKINHWTTGTLCDIMEKKKHCLKVSVHAFEYCWKVNITNELYLQGFP